MNDVLLTVSGTIDAAIDEDIANGRRPLADYKAMAAGFSADLMDYAAARAQTGRFGRLLERVAGPNLMLAWACFRARRRYRVIFTDGEQIGIPLALLLKAARTSSRPRHLTIAHILSVGKKMLFFDRLGVHSHIDTFFVYATWQKQFIQSRWQLPDHRVIFTPFMVDADFFAPSKAATVPLQLSLNGRSRPIICAVGLEFRDYPTLLQAVAGLDVQVVIAAASPWSKREDSTAGAHIPANVLVRRFSQIELRELYAMSAFVALPLYNVPFQAGVTTLLEAMAMEKAVVCTQTMGQTDVVVAGETGLYVPPQDPAILRETICHLLQNPQEAERMGKNGRLRVLQEMSLDCYVRRLSPYVEK